MAIIIFSIKIYRFAVSPFFSATCIHQPSCSYYAILAFRKYGVLTGFFKTLWRIFSCRPNGKPRNKDYP